MKIGFTGSRNGMTAAQKSTILNLDIFAIGVSEAHHGDCIGSDADFHAIMRSVDPAIYIVTHPGHPANTPEDTSKRAFCDADEVRESKPFFPRNRDIVDEVETMVATPATMKEQNYGGTWYTIKYSRSKKRKLYVVYPDGSVGE